MCNENGCTIESPTVLPLELDQAIRRFLLNEDYSSKHNEITVEQRDGYMPGAVIVMYILKNDNIEYYVYADKLPNGKIHAFYGRDFISTGDNIEFKDITNNIKKWQEVI